MKTEGCDKVLRCFFLFSLTFHQIVFIFIYIYFYFLLFYFNHLLPFSIDFWLPQNLNLFFLFETWKGKGTRTTKVYGIVWLLIEHLKGRRELRCNCWITCPIILDQSLIYKWTLKICPSSCCCLHFYITKKESATFQYHPTFLHVSCGDINTFVRVSLKKRKKKNTSDSFGQLWSRL